MKNLKMFEEFKPDLDYAKGGKDSYDVDFDEETKGANHLVMKNTRGKGVYGRTYAENAAELSTPDILEHIEKGYMLVYFGPDIEYAQEIVD